MRVIHLTDLLTWEEIWTCQDVSKTGTGKGFSPIRMRMPGEVCPRCLTSANGKGYVGTWFSAKARYAEELLRRAEESIIETTGMEPERVEWVAASESFNTIRWPNLDKETYVSAVMQEMKRLADSGAVTVRTGVRSLGMGKSVVGEEEERLEIILPDYRRGAFEAPRLEEVLKPGGVDARFFSFSWAEIAEGYAVLTPMQVAFLHEEKLHRHTALDDELLHACEELDEDGIRRALEKGANIHALGDYGQSVCSCLVDSFGMYWNARFDPMVCDLELGRRLLELLWVHGADVDLAGAGEHTALNYAVYCESWMTELLLQLGANPDEPSLIEKHGDEKAQTPLENVWKHYHFDCLQEWHLPDDQDRPDYLRMMRLLFRYGGGGVMMDQEGVLRDMGRIERTGQHYKDDVAKGIDGIQCLFFQAVRTLDVWGANAAIWSGALVDALDSLGRNAVRIALEDSAGACGKRFEGDFNRVLTDFVLFLLGHAKVPMAVEDWRWLAQECRTREHEELLEELKGSPLFGEQFRLAWEEERTERHV